PFDALTAAAARGAVVIIDDVQWLSSAFLRALARPLPGVRLVASPQPWAVETSAVAHTAFELARLSDRDAIALVRELVQPAELLPLPLLERLTVRGLGNPRLLLALARELQQRGAIRRSPAAADWHVADDEFDTLLESPDAGWLAARALESVAGELEPTLRTCAGLGAAFGAAEATAITGATSASSHLESLCHAGILERREDAYRFANADLQSAIYDHVLETRALIHERALAHALAHSEADRTRWLARVAYHAAGCASFALAIACDVALADHARLRDEPAVVAALLARGRRAGTAIVPPALAAALLAADDR
ncbi:MAG TPA: hypothetical protein VFQ65_23315, partial [Kofleriaceae bacterium]|nr:hypothetical protein [Kofleriaceae bacterium]